MNKNATPIILLILALGLYFTFTKGKVTELKAIKSVNASYQEAINNSAKLLRIRDEIKNDFNKIDPNDQLRLEKMLPNNIDNVRLTLDVKSIGLARGLVLKGVKANAPNINTSNTGVSATKPAAPAGAAPTTAAYDTVTLSFSVSTDYLTFLELLKDLETSLRIIDITKITLTVGDTNVYDYGVELKTYWLKQ